MASKFEVIVAFKPEVLDTQARAIQGTLNRVGYEAIKAVQVNKRFVLEIDANTAEAERQAYQIAEKILANPVSEQYQVRRLE